MDTKMLTDSVAKQLGRDPKDISSLLTGLTTVLREKLCDMDTVAIPGFGDFVPVKHLEEVRPDLSTGKLILLPPSITVEFNPSSLLKRKLTETNE